MTYRTPGSQNPDVAISGCEAVQARSGLAIAGMTFGPIMLAPKLTLRSLPRLRFHDAWITSWITLPVFAVGMTAVLFAMIIAARMPELRIKALAIGSIATIAAFGVYWLGELAHFDVTIDIDQISSRTSGDRWSVLQTGSMSLQNIRSIHERVDKGILEIRGAASEILEIPMRVRYYKKLYSLLSKMVHLYGEGTRNQAGNPSVQAAALIAMEYEI
jgi:hypothetical protein